MSKFVDLVLVRHTENERTFLFQAPAFSHLKKGERVLVSTMTGSAEGTVVASETFDDGSDAFAFIVQATGAYLPLRRVMQRISYTDLSYEEDAENE